MIPTLCIMSKSWLPSALLISCHLNLSPSLCALSVLQEHPSGLPVYTDLVWPKHSRWCHRQNQVPLPAAYLHSFRGHSKLQTNKQNTCQDSQRKWTIWRLLIKFHRLDTLSICGRCWSHPASFPNNRMLVVKLSLSPFPCIARDLWQINTEIITKYFNNMTFLFYSSI